jgi:hypothetical protein
MASFLSSETAKKYLSNAESRKHFKLHLGSNIRSLSELSEALDVMDQASYDHHVHNGVNDFSVWISDVIGDDRLAKEVAKLKLRTHIRNAINKRIVELEALSKGYMPAVEDKKGLKNFFLGFMVGAILVAVGAYLYFRRLL